MIVIISGVTGAYFGKIKAYIGMKTEIGIVKKVNKASLIIGEEGNDNKDRKVDDSFRMNSTFVDPKDLGIIDFGKGKTFQDTHPLDQAVFLIKQCESYESQALFGEMANYYIKTEKPESVIDIYGSLDSTAKMAAIKAIVEKA